MDRSNKNINFDGILEIQKNNIYEALSDTIGPFTGIYPGTQFGFASRLKGMIESACGKGVDVRVCEYGSDVHVSISTTNIATGNSAGMNFLIKFTNKKGDGIIKSSAVRYRSFEGISQCVSYVASRVSTMINFTNQDR